jgi:hypothetical protein
VFCGRGSSRGRGEVLKEAESPSLALGVLCEGAQANGVRPKVLETAKHFFIELPKQDASKVMKNRLAIA